MKLYQKIEKDRLKINIKDIVYLTSQLDKFIQLYDKNFYEETDEQRLAIQRLKEITTLLKRRQYDTLFEHQEHLIEYNVSNEKFEPEELKAWNDFFKRNPY